MADLKIVNEWLSKADEDFHFAVANLKEGSNFYAQICFHFQQAAEKYLKALQAKQSTQKIAKSIKNLLAKET